MKAKRNAPFRGGRGIVSGGGAALLGLLGASRAEAQTPGDAPNAFVRVEALEGIQSYEVLPDGTLKVVLADGRVFVLAADQFVMTEAGLFLDLPALTEAMTATAAASVGGSPLLMPFLAAGGAGAAAAAAAGGGGGGGDGGGASTVTPPAASPPPPPPPLPPSPPTNSAPIFTSGIAASVAENATGVAYTAAATDADGNALSYSLSGTDAALFNIDRSTGAVTFRTAPDFEAPADAGGNNAYDVIVSASDGTLTTSQNVTIAVTNLNDSAPVFTSGGAVSVQENIAGVVYTAAATDADGSTLTYSLSGTDAARFNIDSATGAVTFKVAPDFEAPSDAGGNGIYDVIVSASDGVATTAQAVAISVTNLNDVAPAITAAGAVGAMFETSPSASGSIAFVDGDLLGAHSVSVAASGAGYVGNFSAVVTDAAADGVGAIGWTYTADGAGLAYLAAGETLSQTYVVTVSDGVASATQTVVITITGTNQVPEVHGAAQSAQLDEANADASGAISFSDSDLTDSHAVSVAPEAAGYLGVFTASVGNAATGDGGGQVQWSFAVSSSALQYLVAGETLAQTYTVTIADNHGGASTQTVTIYLNGSDDAPTVTSAVSTGAIVEDGATSASGTIVFADPDAGTAHTVSHTVVGGPYLGTFAATLTEDAGADGVGRVGWTFSVDNALLQQLGAGETLTQTYAVRIHDGAATVTELVTITITGANDAPIVAGSVIATNQDMAISGALAAGDADGDALTFSVCGAPQHGALTLQANGAYSYTPAAGYHGADSFAFDVSDGHGGVTAGVVNIDVARGELKIDYLLGSADVASAGLAGTHHNPEIAALSDGGHVVVWWAFGADPDGVALQLFAQRYDAAGDRVGAPTEIADYNSTEVSVPSVAGFSDGGFVVVWQGYQVDGSGLGIFAQRYGADGAPDGGSIFVNANGFLEPQYPSVATLAAGGFVVSWRAFEIDGGSYDVWARVFDANGAPVTADFVVNTVADGEQDTQGWVGETIARLAGGRLAIVFVDEAGADGSDAGVYVRVFEANGTPVTAQVLVNTSTTGMQQAGSISALAGGGFVVTWTGVDGSGSGVFAQVFDVDGAKVGGEIPVNDAEASDQLNSKVERLGDGGFVIVWQSDDGSGRFDLHGLRFDADGAKLGGEFVVAGAAGASAEWPSFALRGDGALALVWHGAGGTIDQTIVTSVAEMVGDAKSLIGGAGPDSLLGWDKVDVIHGGGGDDRMAGLGGADALTGGAGKDRFVYLDPAEGGDTITDFVSGEDKIEVSAAGFGGGLVVGGAVTLIASSDPVASSAGGAFLYDTDTGDLFWDRDGSGADARVLIATLTGAPAIGASDIVVTAIGADDASPMMAMRGDLFVDLGVIGAGSDNAGGDQHAPEYHDAGMLEIEQSLPSAMIEDELVGMIDADFVQPAPQDEHGWQ